VAKTTFDVIVVGGGPNGLACAAYLVRAGAHTLVLERRFEWGGTLMSDDYSTPFLWNPAQFILPFAESLPPFVDFALAERGVQFIKPAVVMSASFHADGAPAVIDRGGAGISEDLLRGLRAVSEITAPLVYRSPPPPGALEDSLSNSASGRLAHDFGQLTPADLEARAGSPAIGAMVRYLCALIGSFEPDRPLGLLAAFSLARILEPVTVRGGSKVLANALYRIGLAGGGQYRAVADVQEVTRSASGFEVSCADGRQFGSRGVVLALDPLGSRAVMRGLPVPSSVAQRLETWQLEPAAFYTAHFGIKGDPPRLPGAGATSALMQLVGFDDPAQVGGYLDAATRGELGQAVSGHFTVTTEHDPLQASAGPYGPLHTIRFQACVPSSPQATTWDKERIGFRRRCWETLTRHTEGLEESRLLFEFGESPADLQMRFRTTRGGSLRQGALSPDQSFASRPHPDCSSTRTPLPGLYFGGGGVHPGIPGSMGGGYNAATAVCEDLGLNRWWPKPPSSRPHDHARLTV
jgi:phytoene dehydrogenase-like protein